MLAFANVAATELSIAARAVDSSPRARSRTSRCTDRSHLLFTKATVNNDGGHGAAAYADGVVATHLDSAAQSRTLSPMPATLNLDELLTYTEWERDSWHAWFPQQASAAFATSIGPHGDGRMQTVGDVIRHVFGGEMRYVDRLSDRPLTDPASIPHALEPVFEFGRRSRAELRRLMEALPAARWDEPADHTILNLKLRLTPRKIIVHVLLHEIRHWAQIATVLRQNGFQRDFHDFLFCPALGGDPRNPHAG